MFLPTRHGIAAAIQTEPTALRWHAMQPQDLPAVMAIEEQSYSHPWTRGNFTDGLAAGFHISLLSFGQQLLGYSVTMMGYEEAHLLNITVHPEARNMGLASLLLEALALWSRQQGAQALWLEVRASHLATQRLYQRHGFECVTTRKAYYPLDGTLREDAIIMKKMLTMAQNDSPQRDAT